MDNVRIRALQDLMDIMRDGMSKAYYEGYTAGYDHRSRLEAVESLTDLLKRECE